MTNITKTGDSDDNSMQSLDADNTIKGLSGNDTYTVDSFKDIVVEAANAGNDTLKLKNYNVGTAKAYTLAANVENLDLSEAEMLATLSPSQLAAYTGNKFLVNGNALSNKITAGDTNSNYVKIMAGAGDDTVIGGNNNDNIDGGLGSDTLSGNDGNDTLFGGADKVRDSLVGGAGNDTYILKDTVDAITDSSADANTIKLDKTFTEKAVNLSTTYASAGITTVDASAVRKALTLTGNTGIDTTIIGGSGADVIRGGSSKDILSGGAGNDTFLIDGNENIQSNGAVIDGGAGLDTIKLVDTNGAFTGNTNVSIANFSTVENIDASLIKTTGVTLTGNAANNKITGGSGNDTINGGAGINTLTGGAGNDTYVLNSSKDKVTELANSKTINYGSDTIVLSSSYDLGKTKSYAIIKNTENLDLRQLKMTAAQQAAFLGKTKFLVNGTSSDNAIYSSDDNGQYMKILAGAGNDTIIGGSGNDYIDGGTGNDTIYGGDGDNSLIGGTGNDTYEFDGTESGTTTITDTSGIDTVKLLGSQTGTFQGDASTYLNDYTMIENLDASAITATDLTLNGNNLDNTITGGAGNDTIFGGKGKNTLIGGAGNDTYLVDGKETSTAITDASGNDTVALQSDENGKFAGGSAYSIAGFNGVENLDASDITATNLTLTGNALDNTITGGGGTNVLVGGAGNDTYRISTSEGSITITDSSGTADVIKLVDDGDGAFAGGPSFSLAGYATVENLDASDINATDMTLTGNDLNNNIIGSAGDDSIFGGKGNDTIYGGAGTNVLDGGVGNDTYLIDGSESATTITEDTNPIIGGTDTVKLVADATGAFNGDTSIDMNDFVGVENLDASIIKSDLTITGNELNNTITGGSGSDYIEGGIGDDKLYGGATDGKAPLNSTSKYDSSGVRTSTTDYTYDDDGNIIREDITTYQGDGTTLSSKNYKTYDADGNKLSDGHISYQGDGTTVYSKNDNTYDADGHQLTNSSISYDGDGVTVNSNSSNIFTYDQNGNQTLTDCAYYGWNNSFQYHTSSAYTYDSDRNQTSEEDCYYDSDGNLTSHSSYEYTYYPDGTQKTSVGTGYYLDEAHTVSNTNASTYDSNGYTLAYDNKYFNQDADHTVSSWSKAETTFTVDTHGNPLVGTFTSSDSDGNSSVYKAVEYTYVYGSNGKPSAATYAQLDSTGNQNSYKEFAFTYDSSGKLTGQTKFDYSSDGTQLQDSYTYTYDSQGKRLSEDYKQYQYINGEPTLSSENISTYDAKGNQLSYESFSYDGGDFDSHSKTVYTYGTNGNELTETNSSYFDETDDKISYLRKCTYDSKGTKIGDGTWTYNPDGTHKNTEIYTYYPDGQTQKSYEYNEYYSDGKLQDTDIETYNSEGNSLTSDYKEYDTDGTTVTRRGTGISTYDGEGHQLSYTSESFTVGSDNSLTLQYREIVEYKYDSNGNKTSYTDTEYNSNGSVSYSNTTSYTNTYGEAPGCDTLFGGAGNNTLIGGGGNDTYLVDGSETSTTIIEAANEGNDTVQLMPTGGKFANLDDAAVSIATYANVENLDGSLISTTNLTLTGNDSDNVITGGDANDKLYGGLGNDNLIGDNGDDELYGEAGDDTLSGGLGTNVLDGGAGKNTYLIDGTETSTTIIDTDVAGTIKLVDDGSGAFVGGTSFSLAGYTDVENLDASAITTGMTLQGNANVNGNTLTGGSGNDTYLIDGSEVSTTIVDANGNDTVKLVATAGTFTGNTTIDMSKFDGIEGLDASAITDVNSGLNITGSSSNNNIIGGAGNDTISCGGGSDTISGGAGDDTYLVDGGSAPSIINTDGDDTVKLVGTNGAFTGWNGIHLSDYNGIQNIDATAITNGNLSIQGDNSGNKIIAGDSSNNIQTGTGNDTIVSGSGFDVIDGQGGNNLIDAGDGGGNIYVGSGADTITSGDTGINLGYIDAEDGENVISVGKGANQIFAGKDNDTITSVDGSSYIVAGEGDNTINITGGDLSRGHNYVSAADGNNTITSGTGDEYIQLGDGNNTVSTGDGHDTVITNGGNNSITTGNGDKYIYTPGSGTPVSGADTITTGSGNDTINAGDGENIVDAGNGNNTIIGGTGNDSFVSGSGNDIITGGAGNDTLTGGTGDDLYNFAQGGQKDLITATNVNDTLDFSGASLNRADMLFYTDADDNLFIDYTKGDIGNDIIEIKQDTYDAGTTIKVDTYTISIGSIIASLDSAYIQVADPSGLGLGDKTTQSGAIASYWATNGGNDYYSIDGTESLKIDEPIFGGRDTLTLVADGDGKFVATGSLYSTSNTIDIDSLSTKPNSIENINANAITATDLKIIGNDANNQINVGSGNNTISSHNGNDTIYAGGGDNVITTGNGTNTIYVGNGDNIITSGSGIDRITLGSGNNTVSTGDGNDQVFANSGGTGAITTGNGNDYIEIQNGNYTVSTGDGNDYINKNGYFGDNVIDAGDGKNTIYGGYGHQSITAGSGDDYINNNDGNDSISTGAGNDYVYAENNNNNVNLGAGNDQIDIYYGNYNTIATGAGNDTINSEYGDYNTYVFSKGDGQDQISGTNINDVIKIDTADGVTTADLYFYKGYDGSFYIDYTDNTVGGDVVHINTSYFSPDTKIEIGDDIITIGAILDTIGNHPIAPSTATLADKTSQAATLASTWAQSAGDNIYTINGTETTGKKEFANCGNDTLKLVANGTGGFVGSSLLYASSNEISIDNLSTTSNTIENLDASAITTTGLILQGNDLDNLIVGSAGSNEIYGNDGNDTIVSGKSGDNNLVGGYGDDTYVIDHITQVTIDESTGDGEDTVKLTQDSNGKFAGFDSYTYSIDGSHNPLENIDASSITNTNLILQGNTSSNTLTGGDGNDTISGTSDYTSGGGLEHDVLIGGKGNDTYWIDGTALTTVTDTEGNDTIKLDTTSGSNGGYVGTKTISLTNYTGIENLDASKITNSNLTLNGNDAVNVITGGGKDDVITGGKGDDVLNGGLGANTFVLNEGDGKDLISATDATDTVSISDLSGVAKDDLLFYTDAAGNFFVDYTDGGFGVDVAEIATGYSSDTTIQLGYASVSIGSILATVNPTYLGVTDPSGFGTGDKTTQAASLTSQWSDPSGDSTYLINGSETKKIAEGVGSGNDTIKLTTTDGSFAGSNNITINDLSKTANTIENVDASAITLTPLAIEGNNLSNTITGGAGNDTISGCDFTIDTTNGWDSSMGGSGADSLYGGLGDDTYLLDGTGYLTINDAGGNDTVKLVANSSGNYVSSWIGISLSDYTGIENIDASAIKNYTSMQISANSAGNHTITTGNGGDTISAAGGNYTINTGNGTDSITASGGDMIVTTGDGYKIIRTGAGNDSITTGVCGIPGYYDYVTAGAGNDTIVGGDGVNYMTGEAGNDSITGGSDNDTLIGGTGNDTLSGGLGSNLYGFSQGDGKDLITATSATDNIYIYDWSSSTKMLFYTDATGNLYADYTDTGIGSSVVEIAAGQYDSGTTIQLGSNKIYVNDILSQLSVASGTAGLDASGLAALSTANESAQVTALASAWHSAY